MFLWSAIGPWAYAHLGGIGLTEANFAKFEGWYAKYDFWIVFTCGFTPLPYKVCTISAGVAQISFPGFVIASAISARQVLHCSRLMGWKVSESTHRREAFNWLSRPSWSC
jgi:membrane protein DedA with SNARE-associated domain